MGLRNTTESYGSIAKFNHWLMFIIILSLVIVGFGADLLPKTIKGTMIGLHKSTGILALMLILLRSLWTLSNPKPTMPAGTPAWQKLAERSGHLAMYLILFAIPLSGIAMSTAANKIPSFYGLFDVAMPFVPQSKALAKQIFQVHSLLGWTISILVVIHVAAALVHHYVKKDNVLKRMMPSKG